MADTGAIIISITSIFTFTKEMAHVMSELGKESSETITEGNMLKVNDRQVIREYLDIFGKILSEKIILPTRFSLNNCILIDQIHCKILNNTRAYV